MLHRQIERMFKRSRRRCSEEDLAVKFKVIPKFQKCPEFIKLVCFNLDGIKLHLLHVKFKKMYDIDPENPAVPWFSSNVHCACL